MDEMISLQMAADSCGISVGKALDLIRERNLPFWLQSPTRTWKIDHPDERLLFIKTFIGGQPVKLGPLRSKRFDTPDFCTIENILILKADLVKLGGSWPIIAQQDDEPFTGSTRITKEFNLAAIALGKINKPLSWSTIQKRHYREIRGHGLNLSYPSTGKKIPSISKSDLRTYIESL